MEPQVIATRPSLMSLVAYLDERASILGQPGDEELELERLLRDCVQTVCLVMVVYDDIPLIFSTLSNAANRLVRAERTPATVRRALASAIRLLKDAGRHRGERLDQAVSPVSHADIRKYLDVRDTFPHFKRRIKGKALSELRRAAGTYDHLEELQREFGLPSDALLERVIEGLRNLSPALCPT